MVFVLLSVANKILAIKFFRLTFSLSLHEAKEVVEAAMTYPGISMSFSQFGKLYVHYTHESLKAEQGFFISEVKEESPVQSMDGIVERIMRNAHTAQVQAPYDPY
jgi:hypothetical protein